MRKEIKVVLMGAEGVGKTSLVTRFINNRFYKNVEETIGAGLFSSKVQVDDVTYPVSIWDTAGNERYDSLRPMYYRDASIALLAFSDQKTFSQIQALVVEVKKKRPDTTVIMVRTKSDLLSVEQATELDTAVAQFQQANDLPSVSVVTSAKDNVNCADLLQTVMQAHLRKLKPSVSDPLMTRVIANLERYIENRDKGSAYKKTDFFHIGYSKGQKIAAATALITFLKGENDEPSAQQMTMLRDKTLGAYIKAALKADGRYKTVDELVAAVNTARTSGSLKLQ